MKQVKDEEEDLNAHNLKRSAPCGVVMKKMKNVESVASVFMVCSHERLEGEMLAIMTVRVRAPMNASRSTCDPRSFSFILPRTGRAKSATQQPSKQGNK